MLSIPQLYQVIALSNPLRVGPGIDVQEIDRNGERVSKRQHFLWLTSLRELLQDYRKKQNLYYRYDGHLTPAGNQVVADYLVREFESFITR